MQRNLDTRLKWVRSGISADPRADVIRLEQSAAFPLELLFRENLADLEALRDTVREDLPNRIDIQNQPLDTYQDAARLIHRLLQEPRWRGVAQRMMLLLAKPYVCETERQQELHRRGRLVTFQRECPLQAPDNLSLQARQEALHRDHTHMGRLFPAMAGSFRSLYHGAAFRYQNRYYGWLYQHYLSAHEFPGNPMPGIGLPYAVAQLYDLAQEDNPEEQEKNMFLLQCAIIEPYWEEPKIRKENDHVNS